MCYFNLSRVDNVTYNVTLEARKNSRIRLWHKRTYSALHFSYTNADNVDKCWSILCGPKEMYTLYNYSTYNIFWKKHRKWRLVRLPEEVTLSVASLPVSLVGLLSVFLLLSVDVPQQHFNRTNRHWYIEVHDTDIWT